MVDEPKACATSADISDWSKAWNCFSIGCTGTRRKSLGLSLLLQPLDVKCVVSVEGRS